MKKISRHLSLFQGTIIIAAITSAAFFFWFRTGSENHYSNKEVEVEVIEGAADHGTTLSGVLQDEATEESIEHDASNLEMNVDNGDEASSDSVTDALVDEDSNPPMEPVITPKASAPDELKIGFVTDIHARSDSTEDGGRTLKQFFRDGISRFVDRMNESFNPNFIVANGDLIEGTGRSSSVGKKELSRERELFEKALMPKYWVVGNHDLRSVNKSQWKKTLGIDYLSNAFEIGDYKILTLDSNFTSDDEDIEPHVYNTRGRVSAKELNWLEKELGNTEKKIIIFMHNPPLWNVDLKSNGRMPGNALAIQDVFSHHKVLAVFSGHLEDLYINENGGVKYFVLPGFVKNKKYQKTFSEITVKGREIVVDMSYLADENNYRTVRITD